MGARGIPLPTPIRRGLPAATQPTIPPPPDTAYTPTPYDFAGFAAAELGTAATDQDGFSDIFTPMATSFPGPDVVVDQLDPLIADLGVSAAALGAEPDPAIDQGLGDLGTNLDAIGGVAGEGGANVQLPPLGTFPLLSSIQPGQLPPGFIQTDTQTGERELPNVAVRITNDGNVSWYVDPTVPDDIQVFVAEDGGGWTLWDTGYQGNSTPDWIEQGHFYAFEWRNGSGTIAQAYLDLRGALPQGTVVTPGASTAAGSTGLTTPPPGNGPSGVPDIPPGLPAEGLLDVLDDGTVYWSTSNVGVAEVTVDEDGQGAKIFSDSNQGKTAVAWITPGHRYKFELRDITSGRPGLLLDLDEINLTHLPAIPPPTMTTTSAAGATSTTPISGSGPQPPDQNPPGAPPPSPPAGGAGPAGAAATGATTPPPSPVAGEAGAGTAGKAVSPPPPTQVYSGPVVPGGPVVGSVIATGSITTSAGVVKTLTIQGTLLGVTTTVAVSGPAFIPVTPGSTGAPAPGYSAVFQGGKLVGFAFGDQLSPGPELPPLERTQFGQLQPVPSSE